MNKKNKCKYCGSKMSPKSTSCNRCGAKYPLKIKSFAKITDDMFKDFKQIEKELKNSYTK